MVVHSALPDPLTQAVEELLGRPASSTSPTAAPSRSRPPHGDPVDPPVWLWRADAGWRLTPERPL
jgi:hypothetical protein